MNEIYTNYQNILFNFFIPQLEMTKKYREGAKYKRFYDAPKTPYQRLMESKHIPLNKKSDLERVYNQLNPISLRREMSKKLAAFKKIVKSIKNNELDYQLA